MARPLRLAASAARTFVLAAALSVVVALPAPVPVRAATLVVITTADSGPGSLRDAITLANAAPGHDQIQFAIPGMGVKTIAPLSELPTITDPLTIDGYTQPGAAANTLAVGSDAVLLIELSGASAPQGSDGLRLDTDDSVISGLVINGWKPAAMPDPLNPRGHGVSVLAGADRNVISGNFIGTNAAGTAAVANRAGVHIVGGADSLIGGASPAARNVISGNAMWGIRVTGFETQRVAIQGNYVGTNASGTGAVPNETGVFVVNGPADTLVGGTAAAARNIISGNTHAGVNLTKTSGAIDANPPRTVVQGNWVGLDATGAVKLGNGIGVFISSVDGATVGGATAGAANVVSGNIEDGILITRSENAGGVDDLALHGNLIGTTPAGDAALGNGGDGIDIEISAGIIIGGSGNGDGNLISGNGGHGIHLHDDVAAASFFGNRIGTDLSGSEPLGNGGHGIFVPLAGNIGFVGSTEPGARNVIAFNALDGIAIKDGLWGISGNSIHSNGGLGIDLGDDGVTPNDPGDADDGPNQLQNHPTLASAVLLSDGTTRIRVQLDVQPNDTYTVEFFSNGAADPTGFGEGQTYLGSADIVVGPSGTADELVTLPVALPVGTPVTSTISFSINAFSSEFSNAIEVVPAIRIDDVIAAEGDTGMTDFTFTVALSGAAEGPVTVDYATADDTATAPADYLSRSGSLTFSPGDTTETVTVRVNGDLGVEPDERFFVDLANLSLGADAVEDGRGHGGIMDDDAPSPTVSDSPSPTGAPTPSVTVRPTPTASSQSLPETASEAPASPESVVWVAIAVLALVTLGGTWRIRSERSRSQESG